MAKKKETVEVKSEVAVSGAKPKITTVWFKENDDYYNSFFMFSDSKDALDDIRKRLDTNGDVWDKQEYPLICKKIMKIHNKYFADNDYFFFRGMHDNESDIRVEEIVCQDLIDSLHNEQMALLHTGHECKFVSLWCKMIIDGVAQSYDFEEPIVVTFTEIDKLGI